METPGTNDIIIGLSDIRRYDLTAVFRHIYRTKDANEKSNETGLLYRQERLTSQSPSSSQGMNAEFLDANETFLRLKEAQRKALDDPAVFSTRVNTSQRVLLPPHLKRQIITRGRERSNIPKLPQHIIPLRVLPCRSPCFNKCCTDSSPLEELSPGYSCQPSEVKSLNDME